MGFFQKIMNFIAPPEGDEDTPVQPDIDDEPVKAEPQRTPVAKKQAPVTGTQIVLFEPASFSEAEEPGQALKEGKAAVVNLQRLDAAYAQRTIDFLTGVVFALDGKISAVGPSVILCTPAEIGVSGTISLQDPDEEDEYN